MRWTRWIGAGEPARWMQLARQMGVYEVDRAGKVDAAGEVDGWLVRDGAGKADKDQ
jgi:hypothetical protein